MRSVAQLLPGAVATAIALIYVVGSLNAAGAFARDGVSVAAVRLLSIEQLLVRGVSVLTQPTTIILLAACSVGFALVRKYFESQAKPQRPGGPPRHVVGMVALSVSWTFLGPLVIGLFLSWRIGVVLAIFPCAVLVSPLVIDLDRHRNRSRIVLVSLCTGLAAFLAANYFGAFVQPLASYRLRSAPSPRHSGVLLTHTNGTWYIDDPSSNAILSFADEQMLEVELKYRSTSPGDSLLEVLCG
jgi:hypothetical protein